MVFVQIQQFSHQAYKRWLRNGLAEANWQWMVFVSAEMIAFRHKELARDSTHRRHDPGVGYPACRLCFHIIPPLYKSIGTPFVVVEKGFSRGELNSGSPRSGEFRDLF